MAAFRVKQTLIELATLSANDLNSSFRLSAVSFALRSYCE